MSSENSKPWEGVWTAPWRFATSGKRRFVTIPLFLVFVTLPAVAGFTDGLVKLRDFFYIPPSEQLSQDEWDVFEHDEWVLVLDTATSKLEAEAQREQFKKDYHLLDHTNFRGQEIWMNDVLVIRSPRRAGQWLVVLDMYDGQSTRNMIQSGLHEMLSLAAQDRNIENVVGRWLNGAAPAQMLKNDFRRIYGDIVRKPGAL